MKIDLNNINHQLIVAGITGLVTDDGLTPREVFELLEEIKRQTFHALVQIKQEGDEK